MRMGHKKGIRLLALVMAVVCTLTVVAAAANLDANGDGKVTVWDLQQLVGGEDYAAALKQVLGGKGDELNPNKSGAYEIWSEMGWKHFVENADQDMSFELKTDIDLKGGNWAPLVFTGSFNGNGHTIKNANITKSVNLSTSDECRMGFFAGIQDDSEVVNLNLENVNLIIDAEDKAAGEGNITRYAGLLAGHNRGTVENCTATGSVTDNRTELSKSVFVGALVGQNVGKLYKGDGALLTATAGTGKTDDKVEGISAKLATVYAEADKTRYTGIVGFSEAANMDSDMLWQDTSNSTAYASEAEQTRRNTVVAEMEKMGTVKWTPSQTITFTRFGDPTLLHSNAYIAGKTYTGIPYVGARDGNYDRFMSQMQAQKDEQGRYVTVTGLKDGTQSTDYKYDGFVTMMGSSCHWAVIWSWSTVSPHRTDDGYGGVAVNELGQMIPTAKNVTERGALAVGSYAVDDNLYYYDNNEEKWVADPEATQKIIAANGVTTMAECYAQASKGDAIVFKGITLGGDEDGHTRLLSQDPVIIRKGQALSAGTKTSNDIDLDKSYILFHGQGDGLSDKSTDTHTTSLGTYTIKYTSWRLDHKVTLNALLTEAGAQAAADGGYWGFIPVTIEAFSAPSSFEKKVPYYNPNGDGITLPNTGSYYSNYKNVSATMVIKDASGEEVYNKTAYMMKTTITPNVFYDPLDLGELFPDVELDPGTYTATLSFKAANGTTTVVKNNEAFTVAG